MVRTCGRNGGGLKPTQPRFLAAAAASPRLRIVWELQIDVSKASGKPCPGRPHARRPRPPMIVVVGSPVFGLPASPESPGSAEGPAARIALAAASAGADVQVVGKVGEDAAGDEVLIALARGAVGHMALLRVVAETPVSVAAREPDDGGPPDMPIAAMLAEADPETGVADGAAETPRGLALDAADVSLGLQYLVSFRVVVAADPVDEATAQAIADAAAFADAAVIAVTPPGAAVPAAFGRATVLEAPEDDPGGEFAALVGRFAAALDRGAEAGPAFREAAEAGGWQAARP
jgi:hypothetical protein